eukprot:jgi/Antlo1/1371/1214
MKTANILDVWRACLLVLATACLKASKLDAGMQFINDLTYKKLKKLIEKDTFSIVYMNLNERCPLNAAASDCTSRLCRIESRNSDFRLVRGPRVDLRHVQEGYSSNTQNTSLVWKRLYELSSKSKFLQTLLSGLHFSITIHVSSFFTFFHGIYIPNSIHYFQRYRREYKKNMYILYLYVRSSLYILGKGNTLVKMRTCNGHASPDPRADVKQILCIREMLSVVNCLSCDRCKVWGKVQLQGLIAATKIHLSMNPRLLSKNELICLVRLFHKLSRSIVEMKKLESFPYRCISVFAIYRAEAMYVLLGIVFFWRFRPKT